MGSQKKTPMNFKTTLQTDVPQGRNGKHKGLVTKILSDLDQVQAGIALKIPLAALEADSQARSLCSRMAFRRGGVNSCSMPRVIWAIERGKTIKFL